MKKITITLFALMLGFGLIAQTQVPWMISDDNQNPMYGPGNEFICTTNAFFGQDPNTSNAYTSDINNLYQVYDNFTGISSDIVTIDWWGATLLYNGVWSVCTENPKSFEISFFQDNAGAPGTLVYSFTVSVTGQATGQTIAGFPIYKFSADLPVAVTGLTNGWVSIFGAPAGSCSFLWEESDTGDNIAFQNASSIGTDLSFCLYGETPSIPLSNWALVIGLLLISGFIVVRFRTKMA